ncbi:unnamed protein product, partial [Mesorhabditis belari]|uniref:RING-type domain-containing protein n=1 Tax=Mesorhabditis belari TaxID=2138241 RepID=A0AAF3EWV5_9BILA
MPGRRRLNVDDYHSSSSPVRRRRRVDENGSNTPPRNAGMLSKEQQERRDAEMALELQREEEELLIRERAQVIEPTLTPGALLRIIGDSLATNAAPAGHLGTLRRNNSNVLQRSRGRHNRTRSRSLDLPRDTGNNVVVLLLNSGNSSSMQAVADTLIEIGTRMQAVNGLEFNVQTDETQSMTSDETEEIESDESVDLEESMDTEYSSSEMSFTGLNAFESDEFEDSSNGSLSSEDSIMYSDEHERGLTDSGESDVHLNDSMDDLESENNLSTGDKNDDESEEGSTQSFDSEDDDDDDQISDGEISDYSSESEELEVTPGRMAIYLSISEESLSYESLHDRASGGGSMNDAQIELASSDGDDMFDGELTLGDDSEIDSGDSEDGDDEDENESIASSNDGSDDHSIEEEGELNGASAGSTTEEGESGDDDDVSSLSSGSSMDGPLGRHLMSGQLLRISNLLLASERRERRDTTPLEEPRDETMIQCSDWGQCTICFEDAPYDPVGCLHCQQLIGCKPCVNRWFLGSRRQRADSPLSLGLSGVNHRQCPLCRHEYEAGTPEVGSMFVLAPKH